MMIERERGARAHTSNNALWLVHVGFVLLGGNVVIACINEHNESACVMVDHP